MDCEENGVMWEGLRAEVHRMFEVAARRAGVEARLEHTREEGENLKRLLEVEVRGGAATRYHYWPHFRNDHAVLNCGLGSL